MRWASLTETTHIAMAVRADYLNPHHQEVIEGVQRYASDRPGWRCVIDEHPGDAANDKGQRYDGVVARASPAMQKRMRDQRTPMVNVWYQHAKPEQHGVYLDLAQAGAMVAEHLIQRGFRRLYYIGVQRYRHAKEVDQAIANAARENHCDYEPHAFGQGSFDERRYWYRIKSELNAILDAAEPPIGVIALTPTVARLMLTLAEGRGLRVPIDLAMICMENARTVVELPPQITCIDNDFTRVGYEAAAMLDRVINGRKTKMQVMVPPRGIITRESTDHFAVEDHLVAKALQYITQRLDEKLTVERLAYELAVSTRTLQHRFEAALGTPVSHEVRRLRLELAKRLLGERDLLIGTIAKRAGFTSSAIMGEVFQRELGLAPSAYRKRILTERGD